MLKTKAISPRDFHSIFSPWQFFLRLKASHSGPAMAPTLDLEMVNSLGRHLHPGSGHANGLLVSEEEEVCPWTLFLTMALTLLKGTYAHTGLLYYI